MWKKLGWLLLAIGIVLAVFAYPQLKRLRVVAPAYQAPGEIVHLEQGWSPDQQQQFHHISQGTRLVPYAWFLALEQPCLSPFGCDLLATQSYLGRFGFLPSPKDSKYNPDGLPIGFARDVNFHDPDSGKNYTVVGLNCAACHTGELHYNTHAVRIEGGVAMIQPTEFQKALGIALLLTESYPGRYGRFERRVLGDHPSDTAKQELRTGFEAFLKRAKAELSAVTRGNVYPHDAGFGRTDALTRIGNQVFAMDMQNEKNFAQGNSPVRFPQVWDASWFTWVQYNSSIADPLVRNIGEALGVRAVAKLYGPTATSFDSSIDMPGLKALEDLLSGPAPLTGLKSPQWPAIFPPLDPAKVTRGEALYREHCQGCHLPPRQELERDLREPKPQYWVVNPAGKRFLNLRDIPLPVIGTDPQQATLFMNRTADTGALNKGIVSAGAGLELVTKGIRDQYFAKMNFSPEQRAEWSGYRSDNTPAVRAQLIYKARPLNGIWACAPYLHNGSVPNLYSLLTGRQQRGKPEFWLGNKNYDPIKVGYETGEFPGGYKFEYTHPGNSNEGHWFEDGPRGNGVVGPNLPESDRWALIEYLKSI
ncbi:di-heme-cytochrome C peroxidase [Bryobacter aggregatus]|uniref:di-heme-cytochrome C peroxidase n=1 Tax=Bryobacter aggregatus TaxID=360054 RepID=UPI000691366C|nr:di-heme-cytochrome C peroxidase [Bryobacter aggregatus]